MGILRSSDNSPQVPSSSELLSSLPLCSHPQYYRSLEDDYPRHPVLKALRWLFAHFAVDVLTGAGLATALAQQLASALSKHGLAALSVSNVLRSPIWQMVTAYPAYVVCGIALLVALIPFGYKMRDDEKREAVAIARREAGEKLANGYRLYLDQLEQECARLPPLLWGRAQDMAVATQPAMRFVPLGLTKSVADNLKALSSERPRRLASAAESRLSTAVPPLPLSSAVQSGVEAIALAHDGAIVVRAPAGAGKTMLLRQLALSEIERQHGRSYPTGRTPFLLDLSIADLANNSFHTLVRERVRRISVLDDDIVDRIVSGIEQGPSIVLIDGLDELKTGRPRQATLMAIDALSKDERPSRQSWEDWTFSFPTFDPRKQRSFILGYLGRNPVSHDTVGPGSKVGMQIAVGSRPATLQFKDLDAQVFERWDLLPVTSIEIQRRLVAFVLSVMSDSLELQLRSRIGTSAAVDIQIGREQVEGNSLKLDPNTLLALLNKNTQTRGWSSNPLILTLAAVDWASTGGKRVAVTRVALYRSAIAELMRQRTVNWSGQERINLLRLAEDTALRMYELGIRSLTADRFQREIADALPPDLLSAASWPSTQELGGDLLLTRSGIFVAEEEQSTRGATADGERVRYKIFHRTFLEYLAARALARRMVRRWPSSMPMVTIASDLRQFADQSQGLISSRTQGDLTDPITHFWRRRITDYWFPVLSALIGILTEPTAVAFEPDLTRPTLALAIVTSLSDFKADIGLLGIRRAAACMGQVSSNDPDARREADRIAQSLVTNLIRAVSSQDSALAASLQDTCLQMAESELGRQAVSKALVASETRVEVSALNRTLADLTLIRVRTEPDEARRQLYHTDIEQRVSAARAFEAMGPEASFALPDLRNRMADPDPRMRLAVVGALGALGPVAAPAIPRLLDMLNDDNDDVRTAAAEAIRSVGSGTAASFGALPLLVANLHDASPRTSAAILGTLGELGAKGAPVLATLLSNSKDPNSVRAIGSLGSAAQPAVGRLREILQAGTPILRLAAADAVGKLTAENVMPLGDLLKLLGDDDSEVRASATQSLGLAGISAEAAMPDLIAALDDPSDKVRRAAAGALAELDARGASVIADLLLILESGTVRARIASIGALANMGDKAVPAVRKVAQLLTDPNLSTQVRTAEALRQIGAGATPLAGVLQELINGSHQEVRLVAGLVLRQCNVQHVEVTVDFLRDCIEDIRILSLRALAVLGAEATDALTDMLACLRELDAAPEVKFAALSAISNIGLPPALLRYRLNSVGESQPDQIRTAIATAVSASESNRQIPISDRAFRPPKLLNPATLAVTTSHLQVTFSATLIRQQVSSIAQPIPALLSGWNEYDGLTRIAVLAILRETLNNSSLPDDGLALNDGLAPIIVSSLTEELPIARAMAAAIVCERPDLWHGADIVAALIDAIVDEQPEVSMLAIRALAALESKPLLRLLPELRAAALSGEPRNLFLPYAQRRELELIMALGSAMSDGQQRLAHLLRTARHWSVRRRAALILGSIFASHIEPEQFEWLVNACDSDPSRAVRDAANAALARIMSIDPAAPDALDEER